MSSSETRVWPTERVAELLDQVILTAGHHSDGTQACAMDLVSMAVEGKWSDTPECVHPWLAKAVHQINDSPEQTVEGRRRLVLEAGPLLIWWTADRSMAWAVMVRHRAGLTAGGLVDALDTTADRTNLAGAVLSYANLTGVNLSYVNLSYANLTGVNLSYVNLTGVDLTGVDLTYANLSYVNLTGVDLTGVDLTYANLTGAVLSGADLTGANLSGANLSGAMASSMTRWPVGFSPGKAGVMVP